MVAPADRACGSCGIVGPIAATCRSDTGEYTVLCQDCADETRGDPFTPKQELAAMAIIAVGMGSLVLIAAAWVFGGGR